MSLGPFSILPVIERLQQLQPMLRKVEGAAELADVVARGGGVTPAAFVLLASERAAPKLGASGRVLQNVEATFAVAIQTQNFRVGDLARNLESLEPILAAVRDALVGWRPDTLHTGCELGDSRLVRYDAGLITWTQLFRCSYRAQKAL